MEDMCKNPPPEYDYRNTWCGDDDDEEDDDDERSEKIGKSIII